MVSRIPPWVFLASAAFCFFLACAESEIEQRGRERHEHFEAEWFETQRVNLGGNTLVIDGSAGRRLQGVAIEASGTTVTVVIRWRR